MRRFDPRFRVCDVPRFPPSAVTHAADAGTVIHQQQATVPLPVAAAFGGVDQLFHLEAGEVLAPAVLFLPAARLPPRFCRFPSVHRFVESLPPSEAPETRAKRAERFSRIDEMRCFVDSLIRKA
jgi:hypothetical protein